jgi:hypothetical protein
MAPIAAGGVECVANFVPRERGPSPDSDLDAAKTVSAESVVAEPALDLAQQLVRACAAAEDPKSDHGFRHREKSYARPR